MKSNPTRRHFIKVTGAALTATALAPAAISAAETSTPAPGKKRAIKKAIMYGTIGYKGTVLEKFKALKQAGFDGVEPNSHMNQDEVVKAFEETGLTAASVCCNTHWGKPLSDPDPTVREAGLAGLKQALRDAKRYGATSILLVPGVVKGEVSYEDCWKRSIVEIRKAIPLAEELGVKIAIENVWNNFLMKPEQAVAYLEEINSPHVGWHFDIGNMIKFAPSEEWIRALGKRILKLHIKEYSLAKGFGVWFFDGDNHWPAIMKALDETGYTGWGITEQPGDQTKDAANLKKFSELLDRVLAS
jgi:hexulose-6-phosphate isomerase